MDIRPLYLSIIPISTPTRLHSLPVIYETKEKRNFTLCLSPLFFNRSIAYELVEWIEINKLVGVDHFMIYNHTTVGRTDEILRHYEKVGVVKVIQWKLPDYTDVHYFGQIAMMQDCLFRNFRVSRYMLNIDLDELIIPRKHRMTLKLVTSFPSDMCEYSFRSTFMPTESQDVYEGKQKARELNLHFMLRMSRREYIFEQTVRSKYIVNTTCIDTVGIHFCWRYKNGTADTQRYIVPPRESLMYHFHPALINENVRDVEEKAVYKYHTPLIENAKKRWEMIENERKQAKAQKHI